MANEENLKPQAHVLTVEEQSKGGIASGEVRKKKKLMKEQINLLLSLPLKDDKAKKQIATLGIDADNIDNQMAMIIKIYQKALKGDVQAFNTLRDTVGEKPQESINVDVEDGKKLKDVFSQIGGEGLDE